MFFVMNGYLKYIGGLCVFILLCVGFTFALTDPAVKNPSLDLYLESDALVRESPSWARPRNIALASQDITYWKNVLPYEEDRYADIYMVIPQLGLITPIQQIPRESGDWSSMVNGHEISINKYLQGGIIEYASSVAPGHRGKRIDFGHSNYFKKDSGRYKTVFANLMWLDENDEVRYFVKNGDQYTLHRYLVTASYPTKPSNVAPLHRDGDGADALIFGCYHGLDGRRMIEATYIGNPTMPPTEPGEIDEFAKLSPYRRGRVDSGIYALSNMASKRRRAQIAGLYTRIKKYRERYELSEQEGLVLDYMAQGFAGLYQ